MIAPNPRRTCSGNKAFTLVELLVAIAIIATLVAIALPTFQGATQKSRAIRCMANVKQVASALLQWVNDHNGMLPPSNEPSGRELFLVDSPSWSGTGPTWNEYLLKFYLEQNYAIMLCPARPSTFGSGRGAYPDYAYNERLARLDSAPTDDKGAIVQYRKVISIPSPSTKVLLADATRWQGVTPIGGAYNLNDASKIHPRHPGDTAVIAYLDGHVEIKAVTPRVAYPVGFERERFIPTE